MLVWLFFFYSFIAFAIGVALLLLHGVVVVVSTAANAVEFRRTISRSPLPRPGSAAHFSRRSFALHCARDGMAAITLRYSEYPRDEVRSRRGIMIRSVGYALLRSLCNHHHRHHHYNGLHACRPQRLSASLKRSALAVPAR